MKREMMIGLAVGIAAVAIVAIAMGVGRGKKAVTSPDIRTAATQDTLKKQQAVAAALAEAQRAYENKDFQSAIEKTQAILKDVDSTSQEAKNLLQVAQLSQRGDMVRATAAVPPPLAPEPMMEATDALPGEEAAVPADV